MRRFEPNCRHRDAGNGEVESSSVRTGIQTLLSDGELARVRPIRGRIKTLDDLENVRQEQIARAMQLAYRHHRCNALHRACILR